MEERHEIQARGTWTPAGVHLLVREKKITATEAYLLSFVDGLVKCRGEGCWASNAYLGAQLGVTPRYVRMMVRRLVSLKLLSSVVKTTETGRSVRFLETPWSRAGESKDGGTTVPPWGNCSSPYSSYTSYKNKKKREKRPGEAGTAISRSEDNMPFFEEDGEQGGKKHKGTTSFDEDCARRLLECVREVHKRRYRVTLSTWSNEFKVLRKELGKDHPEDRVKAALDFYLGHATSTKEFRLPEVHSARHFRRTFSWVEESMRKASTREESAVKETDTGARVLKRLLRLPWDKGSGDGLRGAVERSLEDYSRFLERVKKVGEPFRVVMKLLRSKVLLDPEDFITRWFEDVNKRVRDWAQWSGSLKGFMWRDDHKEFVKQLRSATDRAGWSTGDFVRLAAALGIKGV